MTANAPALKATVQPGRVEMLTAVPEGHDALVLGRLAAVEGQRAGGAPLMIHVVRDDRRLEALGAALAFFAPDVKTLPFPAWDTVPYDRIGPNAEIVARRVTTLARLALAARKEPTILVTTANAIVQRIAPRAFLRAAMRPIAPGNRIDMAQFIQRLGLGGYQRTATVMEPGEFAVRGGILDLFPPGRQSPVRLDFFGDTLESIRSFDPESQRSQKPVEKLILMPISELAFGAEAESRFRSRYIETFGAVVGDDPLYQTVSAGSRYPGQEHWLPFFHEEMETLFDYCPGASVSFDHQVDDAIHERFAQIQDHYKARLDARETQSFGAAPYKPVPPEAMFLTAK